ncbi:RING zinc finger protein-like protein [Lepidopterella palustris CBS 459.81]|uniref:E3 ubiquitin-protein ligase listerin n=1 Tax=Lepidopterella palustris CBS 459.81 TaxID=1314670 RepID=A0A8E2JHI5_9PEZI|nr:RING zinc finger protein-like protein [Lepidopterella palustris CBS 459.81]
MSKRQLKSQASSSRAASGAFGSGFGAGSASAFGATSSPLSYVAEPPDLSSISDPNVVVAFKNLSKRDSTTKAKALEDLQTYVSSLRESVEEAILEAWIKIYPRTSIDSSRRVRQLAHVVHGQISGSAGKRIAKYMPKAVGAWLCGLYDNDRSVVKSTQESFQQVFSTPEKLQNIRRAYQQPILEYCRDAIDNESTQTLSDERTVSPDDAETKYNRVIASCISVIGSLFTDLKPEDFTKHQTDYNTVLSDENLWIFAVYRDASVRRSTHRFLRSCLAKQQEALENNLDAISKSYLANGLNSDQTGSSYDYVEAMVMLTTAYPTVWTDHYTSKKSVSQRLRQFLKRGSQGGPREFWDGVAKMFQKLPKSVLPTTGVDAIELLSAMQVGIIRKDEPRPNLGAAYSAYLDVVTLLSSTLPEADQCKLLNELVLPIIPQYLRPDPDQTQWTIPGTHGSTTVAKAMVLGMMPSVLETEWPKYAGLFIEDIKTSSPEQSKDFDKSQTALIHQAVRFSIAQTQAIRNGASRSLQQVFSKASASIITEALSVLKARNGKPYGAAGVVAEMLRLYEILELTNTELREHLDTFIQQDLSKLFLSPSCAQLADILYSFKDSPVFENAWRATLGAVLDATDSSAKFTYLENLLASPKIPQSFELASLDLKLQDHIQQQVQLALEGNSDWSFSARILQPPARALSAASTDEILASMTQALSITGRAPYALQGVNQILKHNPTLLRSFVTTSRGSELIRNLLFLAESPDDHVAQEASNLNTSIHAILTQDANGSAPKQSMFEVIQNGLKDASSTSVSVETLVDLAKKMWETEASKSSSGDTINNLFPDGSAWKVALAPFLEVTPKSSLAITNSLAGAVYLIKPTSSKAAFSKSLSRDSNGYSVAFRTALYVTQLIKECDIFNSLSLEQQAEILELLALTLQLANDNLALAGSNNLWSEYTPEIETDILLFMSDAQAILAEQLRRDSTRWAGNAEESDLSSLELAIQTLRNNSKGTSPAAYYSARAHSTLVSELVEIHGWNSKKTSEMQATYKDLRRSQDVLVTAGFLAGYKSPLSSTKFTTRMCGEYVADLTGLDIEQHPEKGLRQLVLLNLILHGQEDAGEDIAKQRVIFFVKHVIPWLQDDAVTLPVKAEVCRTLAILLPVISDIFGSHWVDVLDCLTQSWSKTDQLDGNESGMDSPIPYIHASLKLYAVLRTLTQGEDPNDDLCDAWKAAEEEVAKGLINLLKHSQHFPDEFHQPLKIVNELLARQVSKVPLQHLEESEELFPLLYVESEPVQQTAFDLLHKQIPAAQEQISVDAALEKRTARLPEELLSLILEAPTMTSLADANFDRSMPLPLRGYLLSWLLVFDHLQHASYKVKTDYIEHIKEGEYLAGLLDFMFDFLGHARGKPVDVSKFDVTTYSPDLEPPEKDTQWLLTHLYYLCLKHIPSLAKSWWIDCKSRQKVIAVESWTEKFISPHVISAALTSVSEWAAAQDTSNESEVLQVRVSQRAREVTAAYEVDEQTMMIMIRLPGTYPLGQASVEGVNRVAVDEKKWQSWVRTTQGVITFSNGDLPDGLRAWRRNVVGALKGQTECAICYSIISGDKQLPSKKCSTCKNLFHSSCLFKWFKTSNASSCPLCRNAFNYG